LGFGESDELADLWCSDGLALFLTTFSAPKIHEAIASGNLTWRDPHQPQNFCRNCSQVRMPDKQQPGRCLPPAPSTEKTLPMISAGLDMVIVLVASLVCPSGDSPTFSKLGSFCAGKWMLTGINRFIETYPGDPNQMPPH